MKEELFISGRHIPNIDPHLHIWHWPISVYLFLGGLAAGVLFFAALVTLLGKEKEMTGVVKRATIVVPIALSFGLIFLIYDLKNPLYSWQLYLTLRLESPMSWGAWILLLVTPISFLWTIGYFKEYFIYWDWEKGIWKYVSIFIDYINKYRKVLAWILIPSTIILGIYTGILLSAFNARPLWNNAILGPLFLTSGLSTGAALIILVSASHKERRMFSIIDLILIIIELFLITHLIMGFYAGPQVQQEAAKLLMGGEFTIMFWVFVVILGLAIPAIMEIMELAGLRIPVAVPVLLVLLGGLIFRFVMVDAGQLTRYLY
ncbi:MAG TPA: nitrite reductase [Flavobacteriales bacterium]|jgi:protein NrfD|nr:nitrite reductase [Flavobacteriales bacterium]